MRPGTTPSIRTEPAGGGTERRLVTIMFADLVGSTAFAEGRDPEDVRVLLGQYFDAASEAVQRHGGVVEKFIGDAVMAVWGTPIAHEDDAERAVRSALDIVDRVSGLGARLGITLQARVGVLTGEAVAAVGAVGQGLVAGDLVNTASRLQSAAEPGTVIVGERTFRAASEGIAFVPLDALTLKGKQGKVAAWRALRVISELGGSGRGSAPEPPFVGRDEEMRLAKELLHATGRENRPRLLSVTGVAGIGKSRLVWELRKYIDGVTEPIYWHQGRCPAYGEGVTFWALAEMVRGRAGIAETDDEEVARQQLETCLSDLITDDDERQWLEPRLGHLLGLDAAPPGGRDELFGAWRRFFERVADRGTTVLVFEDLHLADPGLFDFVDSLLAWSRTSPVFVISLARPELAERRPTWGAAVRASAGLHLEPLVDHDIRTLVTGYVEDLPEGDLARLVERAEGIPLYAVETIRMLADRGILEQSGSFYRVISEVGPNLDVPETLHALVAARLDGLPDSERRLVLDASVTGHSFTFDAVCAVSGRSSDDVEATLRALAAKEVVEQDMDPRSAERGQFHFVQSVIQEVAYSTLSKAARRIKHLACARWFADLDEDELAGVVANHFLEAYRAEPSAADSEQIAAQAREWLSKAADRAFSLGSPEAAFAHAVQALSLAATPDERAVLHATAASAAAQTAKLEVALDHFAAAASAYQSLGNPQAEGRLLATAIRYHFEDHARAKILRRLEDVESRLDDHCPEKVLVLAALSDSASTDGRSDLAMRWSELALVMAQTLNDDEALSAAAAARGFALFNAQRHFEAQLLIGAVRLMARGSGSAITQAHAEGSYGVMLSSSDPRGALESFLESAAIAHRAGILRGQMLGLANAAEAAINLGELAIAARALDEVDGMPPSDHDSRDAAALSRALLTAFRGDTASANEVLDWLEATRRPSWPEVQMTTWFLRVRSAVRLVEGDPNGALQYVKDAIAMEASGGNAALLLWQGIQAAATLSDRDVMTSLLHDTAGIRGVWVDAVRATGSAALSALDGHSEEGQSAMLVALDNWRTLNLPLDHALAATIALRVLPTELLPHEDVRAARDYLTELGADGLLHLLATSPQA